MNLAFATRLYRSLGTAIVASALAPAIAGATILPVATVPHRVGTPVVQRQIRASSSITPMWRPNRIGPHVFYGTIAALQGGVVTLRLRNGRVRAIDATAAIASGNFSAPLFVGKTVSIDGTFAAGTFTAAHVYRVTSLVDLRGDN